MLVRSKIDRRFARFCRTGDPDSLAFVFDRTASRLLHVALWLCRNRADADDLLQRTFLQAIALRARFAPRRAVLPWLMGLLSNQALKLRRERDRRAAALPVVERAIDPVAEAAANELAGMVREVRAKLSEPYRDVLELHLEQGLDAGEIAQRLGRPAGTVRTQLVRALELLRRKLPGGFVAGFAPLAVSGTGSLGAVRIAVLSAARRSMPTAVTAMAGAVAAGIGGALMAKKLFVVVPVLALLLGAAVQQVWSRDAAARRAPSASVPVVVVAKPDAAALPSSSTPIERMDVTPAGSVTPPFDPNPLSVPPWDARMLVVDEQDQPVADAAITIWAAKRIPADPRRGDNGHRDDSCSGRLGEPIHRLHTNAEGLATVRLAIECGKAVASKEGFGHTCDVWLNCHRDAGTTLKFVLQVPIALHGVVLRADGLPASHARVSATGRTLIEIGGRDPADPDPVTCDAAGGFEMQVHDLARYTLHAELVGERSFCERVEVRDRRAPEVVLAFPGGITIGGMVVDADGRPVARASVVAWREYAAGGRAELDSECVDAEADAYGRFTLAVMRHARYQLIAAANGHANSTATWTETTVERPHASVRLELQRFAAVGGRIVHGDGSAFAGVRVEAMPETGEQSPGRDGTMPDQESLFGKRPETTTGEDGAFALAVHPGTTWTLRAWTGSAGHRLHFDTAAVVPGSSGVLIRIDDQDAGGCMVHGTVVRADGEPFGLYRVRAVDLADLGAMPADMPPIGRDVPAVIDGDRFTLGPLPRGRQFCVRVLPQDRAGTLSPNTGPMAPLQLGPFTTDRSQVDLVFRLVGWGELPVRVLTADGLPAKGIRIVAISTTVFEGRDGQLVGDDGVAVLQRCVPGSNRVAGYLEQPLRVGKMPAILFDQELRITPGSNRELVIRLPAK